MSETSVAERPGRGGDPRAEKVAVVAEVRDKLAGAGAAILTEYRGLKVAELEALRRSLRQAGGEYKIYKNTLVRFATRELGIDGIEALLEGPTAIAFADRDVPAVAKALRDFSRTNPLLVVKGGLMGSSVLDRRRRRRPRRDPVARRPPRPPGRAHRRADAAVRRPPAGTAPQPGLRPPGAHRPARRRPRRRRGRRSCGCARPACRGRPCRSCRACRGRRAVEEAAPAEDAAPAEAPAVPRRPRRVEDAAPAEAPRRRGRARAGRDRRTRSRIRPLSGRTVGRSHRIP